MKIPDTIYLQWHGDAPVTYLDDEVPVPEDEMAGPGDSDDVTWCADKIYSGDIEYRRADGVCVWSITIGPFGNTRSTPSCGRQVGPHADYAPWIEDWIFCPYCGKKIEVKS